MGWLIFGGPTRRAMLWAGMVCQLWATGGPFLALYLDHRRAVREAAAASAAAAEADAAIELQATLVQGSISPLIGLAAELAELDRNQKLTRTRIFGNAARACLAGLQNLYGGTTSRMRVMYYEVEGASPSRFLVPKQHHGFGRLSRTRICEGDKGRGDEAFSALDEGTSRIWHEGDPAPPPGWTTSKPYKSFIAVPVATPYRVYGMITMDSADPQAFEETDLETVRLVADAFVPIVVLSDPTAYARRVGT